MKSFFNNITPLKTFGIIIIFLFIAVSIILSKNIKENGFNSIMRDIAAELDARKHYMQLNRSDLVWFGNQIRTDRCYDDITKKNAPCKTYKWPNGDPSFTWNPYFNKIPRDTQVTVDIQCDPNEGRFYTNVKLHNVCPNRCVTGANGKQRCEPQKLDCGDSWLKSPYDRDHIGPFSNQPTRWLTSPGKYNSLDFTHFKGVAGIRDQDVKMSDTSGVYGFGRNIEVNELYFTRGGRAAKGTQLTNTILLDTINGIYIHGVEDASDANGFGQSLGCIRLWKNNQKALVDLLRRVGTKNMKFQFGGYGPPDPKLGGQPACSATNERLLARAGQGNYIAPRPYTSAEISQRNARSRQSRNFFQSFFDQFRRKKSTPDPGGSWWHDIVK